jgi:hypothetical protein
MAKTPKSRWLSARPPITIGGAVDPHAAIQHAYRAIAWLYDAVDELGAKISEGPAREEPPITFTSIESQVYIDGGKAALRAYRAEAERAPADLPEIADKLAGALDQIVTLISPDATGSFAHGYRLRSARTVGGRAHDRATLLKIVAVLDGTEWNADHVDAIAEILRADGYMIRDSE